MPLHLAMEEIDSNTVKNAIHQVVQGQKTASLRLKVVFSLNEI